MINSINSNSGIEVNHVLYQRYSDCYLLLIAYFRVIAKYVLSRFCNEQNVIKKVTSFDEMAAGNGVRPTTAHQK